MTIFRHFFFISCKFFLFHKYFNSFIHWQMNSNKILSNSWKKLPKFALAHWKPLWYHVATYGSPAKLENLLYIVEKSTTTRLATDDTPSTVLPAYFCNSSRFISTLTRSVQTGSQTSVLSALSLASVRRNPHEARHWLSTVNTNT